MEDSEQAEEATPDIWYVCKYCGRGYKEAKYLIAHKRANHMAELIERKRQKELGQVPFLHSGLDTQELYYKASFQSTTPRYVEGESDSNFTNNEESNNDDTFNVPIIVKVETQSTAHQTATSRSGAPLDTTFQCELCLEVFPNVSKLYEHQVVHSRKHSCSICTMTYDRLSILNAHMKSVHCGTASDIPSSSVNRSVENPIASASMPSYAKYLTKKIRTDADKDSGSRVMMRDRGATTSSNQFTRKCPFCKKNIADTLFPQHLKNHQRTSNQIRCKFCPFTTRHLASIGRHVKATHTVLHEHQCTLCNASFQRRGNLLGHMVAVHKCPASKNLKNSEKERESSTPEPVDKKLEGSDICSKGSQMKCPLCPLTTKDKTQLRIHMRIHSGEKPFQCKFCPHRSTQRGALTRHMQNVHPSICNEFKCSKCSASFQKAHNLEKHIQSVHTNQRLKLKTRSVLNSRKLEDIISSTHTDSASTGESNHSKSTISATMTKITKLYVNSANRSMRTKALKCKQCPYRSANSWSLTSHVEFAHSQKQAHQCKLCSASYRRFQNLQYHVKNAHPEVASENKNWAWRKFDEGLSKNSVTLDSTSMPILVKQLYSGNDHFSMVGEAKAFVCNICKENFAMKNELEVHLRNHSTYFCKYCNYSSKKENYMMVHMQSIHKDELHESMQDGEYEDSNCEMPQLEAEINPSLNESVNKSSQSELTCPICYRSFKKKRYLESHSVTHSVRSKRFACKMCNTRYIRKGELARHLKSKTHEQAVQRQRHANTVTN